MKQPPPLRRRLRPGLALVATAALTACATPGSGTGPATAPAAVAAPASAWQAPLPHGGDVQALAQWWQRFGEPELPALIEAAQQASPSLAAAQARIERARATAVAAGAAALPRLDAVAQASNGRGSPGAPTVTQVGAGLRASWELDLMGGVAAGREAAQARLQGAQAGWHEARVSLAADVAALVLGLRACEAQREQTEIDARSREVTARLADQSARAGFTAPADAALARAGAAQSRSLARAQQAQCDGLVKALVELTARPEPALRAQLAARAAQLPQPAALAVQAVPGSLLSVRPDLAAAERAVVAAAGDRRQARAAEGVRVVLNGDVNAGIGRTNGVEVRGTTFTVGPLSVSLPLFDGGTARAQTAAAQAAYDEAVALYQAQLRRAVREVETALVALQATAERGRDAESAARDFEAALRATEARQRGGLASLLDLEAARRNAAQAQSALIELQRERVAAWIDLYRALGGGWSAAAPGAAPAR